MSWDVTAQFGRKAYFKKPSCWIAKGRLPERVHLPGQSPFWYAFVIDEWEKQRGVCHFPADESADDANSTATVPSGAVRPLATGTTS